MKVLAALLFIISVFFLNAQPPIRIYGKVIIVNGTTPLPPGENVQGNFTFSLDTSSLTSAGVYKVSDSTLIRTIWSGVRYGSGNHTEHWDGYLDDLTTLAPAGEYFIQVLSNNVQYEWEGAKIGNTSDAATGSNKLRSFEPTRDVCVAGIYLEYGLGYNEGFPSTMRTLITNVQSKAWTATLKETDMGTEYVCSDGNYVYNMGYDAYDNTKWFVYATNVDDASEVTFASGIPFTPQHGHLHSAISYSEGSDTYITGGAVGNDYLFVARGGIDELSVLDKLTGDTVQLLAYDNVRKIETDNEGHIWMAYGSVIEKFTINVNGTLTTTGVSIALSTLGAMAVSPTDDTLAVCDINSQIVRFYKTNDGSVAGTLGTPGGYLTNSTVTNYKFYWKDVRGEHKPYITYLPDGTFWVGDPQNRRMLHFDASYSYLGVQMFLSNNYFCRVDKANPTRIFSDFLEFEVPANLDSWTLKRNWGSNFGSEYNAFDKLFSHVTLSDRTYALARISDIYHLVELVNDGVIRYTGITMPIRTTLGDDGSKLYNPGTVLGSRCSMIKYQYLGLDGSNNPTWSVSSTTLSQSPNVVGTDPVPWEGFRGDITTSNGDVVYYDYTRSTGGHSNGYHLGLIKNWQTQWKWKTSLSTPYYYSGDFPPNGWFDIGNMGAPGNIYAGGPVQIIDSSIFWGYHGEFFKQTQTNKWNHFHSGTGLFVGQFGALTIDYLGQEAYPMGAGNVLSASVVKSGSDTYLYHNDESNHAAVHRWKISRLNTIKLLPVTYPTPDTTLPIPGIDLMAGLITGTTVTNNVAGWTRYPTTDVTTDIESNYWTVIAGTKSYDPSLPIDVHVLYRHGSETRYVDRSLGVNAGLSTWSLPGYINYEGTTPTQPIRLGGADFEILDNVGLVIARFELRSDPVSGTDIIVNGVELAHGTDIEISTITQHFQPFTISKSGSNLTFQYANFTPVVTALKVDALADWSDPEKIRIKFFSSMGNNFLRQVSYKGRFIK